MAEEKVVLLEDNQHLNNDQASHTIKYRNNANPRPNNTQTKPVEEEKRPSYRIRNDENSKNSETRPLIVGSKSQSQFLQNIDEKDEKKCDEFDYLEVKGHRVVPPDHQFNFEFILTMKNGSNDEIYFTVDFKTVQRLLNCVGEELIYFATEKFPSSLCILLQTYTKT